MNQNEPVFPHLHPSCQQINETEQWPGLTKLEWFAGMALQCLKLQPYTHEAMAAVAFTLAEAMLAEAERRLK